MRGILKTTFLAMLTVIFSAVPFLFAAPFVRVNRLGSKSLEFWLVNIFLAVVLFLVGLEPLSLSFISVVVLIGLFTEFQFKFKSIFAAAVPALIAGFSTLVFLTQKWLGHQGINLIDRIKEQVQELVNKVPTVNAIGKLDVDTIVSQAPSALISLMVIALGLALILDDSFTKLMGVKSNEETRFRLVEFKLPDFLIWIAMTSFLLSFLDLNNKAISIMAMNLLNIIIVLYFFQGLAVVECFFRMLRFGIFIRVLTYVVFLVQLFFFVAAIGLVDYWVEFRGRFFKKKIV